MYIYKLKSGYLEKIDKLIIITVYNIIAMHFLTCIMYNKLLMIFQLYFFNYGYYILLL